MFRQGELSTSDVDIFGVSFCTFFVSIFISNALLPIEHTRAPRSVDPFYNTGATLSALQSQLTNLVNTYGKDVVVAETDWPATSCSTAMSASYPDSPVSAPFTRLQTRKCLTEPVT